MNKKNIPRLLINKELKLDATILTENNDQHYLKKVLRLKVGDKVNIFNGTDGEWESTVIEEKKFSLFCNKQTRLQTKLSGPVLYFALIKNHNLRWMIEKATELGVRKFCPMITARTNNKNFNKAKALLHIKEACEVSERLSLPELDKTNTLINILEQTKRKSETIIFCNERRKDLFLHNYLKIQKYNKNLYFLIGPEGGFSKEEEKLINSYKQVVSVKLFDRILRAETAAIMALAIYNSSFENN